MLAPPSAPRRIAIVGQLDPADPRAWSGTPSGLLKGLGQAGAEAVAIDARPPGFGPAARALRRSWTWEATNPAFAAACGAWANRRIAASGAEAAIAIGSGFALDGRVPFTTFEDETIAQAERQPATPLANVPERGLRRWRQRQRLTYERARACCVASTWTGDSLREDYGVDPDKIHVVGCGRNLEQEAPEREWSPPRFLFAGVNWERKRGEG
ncbi:MAG TPA: glycosyltransferase, partial [Solirubrobacterales bacterium]|nr:glycosyltransferase [Solirubrobacterales bacterium]